MPIQKKIPSLEEVEALIEEGTSNIKDSIKNPILLTNEDLNLYKGDDKLGVYYGGGGNASANKPDNVSAFGLIVVKTASGNYSQLMFAGKEGYYDLIKRDYVNSSWTEWENVSESRKLNVNIDCDHEYEITGKTGHEYAVAVPDGQVLIKRINGQTRRKSLNLIDGFYCETSATSQYASSFKCTKLDVSVGKQYTINFKTVNTGAELYVNENLFSFKSFRCDGREYTFVFTCQNIADKLIIFKNTIDNTGRFDPMPIYNIQILEGDYTNKDIPLYQEYDDILVNSKCNLKSIGRNFYSSNDFYTNNNLILNGTTITSSTDTNVNISPKKKFVFLKGITYHFRKLNVTGTLPYGRIYVKGYPWSSSAAENGRGWYFDTESTSFTPEKDIELETFYFAKRSSGDTYSFDLQITVENSEELIPYEESSMLVDTELGEFDYIDNLSHLIIRRTSNIITINAENITGVLEGVNSNGNYVAYTNINTTGAVDEWDTVCGVANNGFAVRVLESSWVRGQTLGVSQNTLFIGSDTCSTLEEFRALCPIKFVFKKKTPATEPIQLEAGYQVWNSGLQIQETETLPYILEKEYAISLSSQVLSNTSLISSLPSFGDLEKYLPLAGGTLNGVLYFSRNGRNINNIAQDGDWQHGLQISSKNSSDQREITVSAPGVENSWSHAQFETSSFPYGAARKIASEEWVEQTYIKKDAFSIDEDGKLTIDI